MILILCSELKLAAQKQTNNPEACSAIKLEAKLERCRQSQYCNLIGISETWWVSSPGWSAAVTEMFRGGTSPDDLVQPHCPSSIRASCPGLCPARFELSPYTEAPLPFWATCSCVWVPPQQNNLFSCSSWISWGLICAHCLCPSTEHCWKEPACSCSFAPFGIYTLW